MTTIEERSDQLDERLRVLPTEEAVSLRLVAVGLGLILILVLIGGTAQYLKLRELAQSNNRVLTTQIPGLKSQIARLDVTISDQQSVIGQAVAAITMLCTKLEARGGDCGRIELKPPTHPPPKGAAP